MDGLGAFQRVAVTGAENAFCQFAGFTVSGDEVELVGEVSVRGVDGEREAQVDSAVDFSGGL